MQYLMLWLQTLLQLSLHIMHMQHPFSGTVFYSGKILTPSQCASKEGLMILDRNNIGFLYLSMLAAKLLQILSTSVARQATDPQVAGPALFAIILFVFFITLTFLIFVIYKIKKSKLKMNEIGKFISKNRFLGLQTIPFGSLSSSSASLLKKHKINESSCQQIFC